MAAQSSTVSGPPRSRSKDVPDGLLAQPPDPCPHAEYLPLASLFLPILGATIHGSTNDWQNLILLGLTLHHLLQVMRLPSDLLRASQPSSIPTTRPMPPFVSAARAELRLIKTLALAIFLASPFIAAGLLRVLQKAMRPDGPAIDSFATRLCFVAAAFRPCAYLLRLFRPSAPSPPPQTSTPADDLTARCRELEDRLRDRTLVAATGSDLVALREEIAGPIADLHRTLVTAARRRDSGRPAAEAAERSLAQATAALVARTAALADATQERAAAVARHKASPPALVLARANQILTLTGTTLQRLGETLAPQSDPSLDY